MKRWSCQMTFVVGHRLLVGPMTTAPTDNVSHNHTPFQDTVRRTRPPVIVDFTRFGRLFTSFFLSPSQSGAPYYVFGMTCPICLDPIDSSTSFSPYSCSHEIHTSCEAKWTLTCLERSVKALCPVCRSARDNVMCVLFTTASRDKVAIFSGAQLLLSWTSSRSKSRAHELIHDNVTLSKPTSIMRNKTDIHTATSILSRWFGSNHVYISEYSLTGSTNRTIQTHCHANTADFIFVTKVLHSYVSGFESPQIMRATFRDYAATKSSLVLVLSGAGSINICEFCRLLSHREETVLNTND